MGKPVCGATFVHPVHMSGLLLVRTYNVTVVCGLPIGHNGRHKGWARGYLSGSVVRALVEFGEFPVAEPIM